MSQWVEVTMKDVAQRKGLVGGPFGSKLVSRDYVETGIPVIRGQNLGSGRWVSLSNSVYVTEVKVERDLGGNLTEAGDLVYTQRGTLGQVAIMPPDAPPCVISQSQMRLRVDSSIADPAYVYYWSKSPGLRQAISDHAIVAGVPHINLGILGALPLSLPPRTVQRAIAHVLGTLDDLIENNRRRVEVLEEMARAIYREWFVKFRYPGHGDKAMVDSALGPIPADWECARLGELAEVRRGISWERVNETTGGTPVVTIPNIRSRLVLAGATELASVSDADRLRFGLREGDLILIGSNGNPARVGYAVRVPDTVEALFASFLMRVRVQDARTSSLIVFHQLTDPGGVIAAIRETAVGATGLRNLRITTLREAHVPLPPASVVNEFESACGPLVRLADQLGKQNDRLESIRDALLPKLVTGEIDVSTLNLDALVAEQVA